MPTYRPPSSAGAVTVLLAVACGHPAPPAPAGPPDLDTVAGTPTTCDRAESSWVDRDVERDHVRHAAGLEADADRAAASLTSARAALAHELGVPSDSTKEVWVWLATASDTIKPGVAMSRAYETQVTLLLPSPSCDPRAQLFDAFLLQQLAGEYLRALTAQTEAGWTFAAGPSWFAQGGAMWLRTCVPSAEDRVSCGIGVAKASPEGAIRAEGAAIAVADPARDGAALIGWLVATRGADAFTGILASDAETFDQAVAAVVGLDGPGMVAEYLQWRSDNR